MSDARTRELERRARMGDPQAQAQVAVERCRNGMHSGDPDGLSPEHRRHYEGVKARMAQDAATRALWRELDRLAANHSLTPDALRARALDACEAADYHVTWGQVSEARADVRHIAERLRSMISGVEGLVLLCPTCKVGVRLLPPEEPA